MSYFYINKRNAKRIKRIAIRNQTLCLSVILSPILMILIVATISSDYDNTTILEGIQIPRGGTRSVSQQYRLEELPPQTRVG